MGACLSSIPGPGFRVPDQSIAAVKKLAMNPLYIRCPRLLGALLLLGLLAGCTGRSPGEPAPLQPVTARHSEAGWRDLPGWTGEHLLASWPAWRISCERLRFREGWQAACNHALAITPADDATVREYFERHFTPWRIQAVRGNEKPVATGLITGYYEPLLTGSRAPGPGRVPLYGVPADLLTIDLATLYPDLKNLRLRGRLDGNRVLPYFSRAEIDDGALAERAEVLVWADDPLDAFFLQVQGSGRVQLENGSQLRIGYADQNGHPYRAIGKWLVEQGEMAIEDVSMQSIRAWAAANPARVRELLAANPGYVFFRELPASDGGPVGAMNVPLTAGASIAVDRTFIPLGTPVWLSTTRPDDGSALDRLMHAQDTGGAIRGPVRADFFWGFGAEAGELAGRMKQDGRLWLLLPKGVKPDS